MFWRRFVRLRKLGFFLVSFKIKLESSVSIQKKGLQAITLLFIFFLIFLAHHKFCVSVYVNFSARKIRLVLIMYLSKYSNKENWKLGLIKFLCVNSIY